VVSGALTINFSDPVARKSAPKGRFSSKKIRLSHFWPAIGLAEGKAESALKSVEQRLALRTASFYQQPAYSHYYLNLVCENFLLPPVTKKPPGVFCTPTRGS